MAAFIQLTPDAAALATSERILKAKDYAVAVEARLVLDDAKSHADKTLADARSVYESEKERGLAEGQAQAQGEVAEQILQVVTRSVDYLAGAEAEVARVVLTCVKKILGEFPEEELVVREAREALQVVRNEPRVTLRVSTAVASSIRERVGEILSGNGEVSFLEVVGDELIDRGSCRLESEAGIVDAGIEQQIEALEQALNTRVRASVTS